ncbi:Rv3235 family protein [Arthrobacter sp. Soc17.1.1.1]|uniref:Rv3235 family protein n=1 Tax=Arthrobacter sp. Soc17.1.1.1 TaxID=3121277 RepID=UPI002FE458C3
MPVITPLERTTAEPPATAGGAPLPLVSTAVRPSGTTAGPITGRRSPPDPLRDDTEGAASAGSPPPTPAADDPETIRRISGIARSVAQGALEVLAGTRPLQQLARWLDAGNYERLQLRANLVRCIHDAPTGRNGGAVSSANRHVLVRSARVCPVSPGVYEASVVAYDRKRVRAVALRIERQRGAWRVTALEIG